jgi:hypothetical protein
MLNLENQFFFQYSFGRVSASARDEQNVHLSIATSQ